MVIEDTERLVRLFAPFGQILLDPDAFVRYVFGSYTIRSSRAKLREG